MSVKLSPSILSADFANLSREIAQTAAGGADYVHVDVMDGHFVPNITIGLAPVKSIKACTALPLDVHLMISDPVKYAPAFIRSGADILTFHLEACGEKQAGELIDTIISLGARPSVSIKPGTPAELVHPFLDRLFMVLVMTVEPGFGGQEYIPHTLDKVRELARRRQSLGLKYRIEVDGGVSLSNAEVFTSAGADVIVAGSAVFGSENITVTTRLFKSKLNNQAIIP